METSDLFSLAWVQLWQITLLMIGVLAANRWIARRRPQLAHLLWIVVLLKCLTPPVVATPWSVFGWAGQQWCSHSQVVPADRDIVGDGYWPIPAGDASSLSGRESESLQILSSGAVEEGSSIDKPLPSVDVITIGLWLWIAGTASVCCAFTVRGIRQWRSVFCFRADDDLQLNLVVQRLAKRLGVRRVSVEVTHHNLGPAVVGLWRPRLILPIDLVAGRNPNELEAVLAHELIHIRRGDLWLAAGQSIVQALWWFHPLVWWGNRLMNRYAECCCDEQVIAELKLSPAGYAHMLLEVLSMKQNLTPVPLFPGIRPVDVTAQRLERIMKLRQGSRRRTPRRYWLIACVVAAVVLPGTWAQTGAQEESHQADSAGQQRGQEPPWESAESETSAVDRLAGDKAEPMSVVFYNIEDAHRRAKQEGLGVSAIIAQLKHADQVAAAAPAEYVYYEPNQGIVVRHAAGGHQRTAKILAAISRFGFKQLAFETRVIKVPRELIDAMSIDWKLVTLPAQEVAPAGLYADDREPISSTARGAAHMVEKQLPALYATLKPEQMKRVLEVTVRDHRTNILQAPTVTLFNGQRTNLMDQSQRPFIVGMQQRSVSEPHRPQVRIVPEGWRLAISGVREDQSIRVDCVADFSTILNVELRELPMKLDGKKVTLQIPEVESIQIRVKATVKDSDTLLVYGLSSDKKSGDVLLVALTPRLVDAGPKFEDDAAVPMPLSANEGFDSEDGPATWRERYQRYALPGGVVSSTQVGTDPPTNKQLLAIVKQRWREVEDVRIVKEKIADYVDPPRFYPLVGPAQLYHQHYKCSVYFRLPNGDEIKHTIYVDHTHFVPATGEPVTEEPLSRPENPDEEHGLNDQSFLLRQIPAASVR